MEAEYPYWKLVLHGMSPEVLDKFDLEDISKLGAVAEMEADMAAAYGEYVKSKFKKPEET